MTVQLRSLRVTAEMDASSYTRGAQQVASSSVAAAAGAKALGQSLAEADAAASGAGTGSERFAAKQALLSRRLIEGYKATEDFNKAVRDVGRSVDTGMGMDRAGVLLDQIYRKFGQTADGALLAKQGFVSIVPVVDQLNGHYRQQAAALDAVAAAQQKMAQQTRAAESAQRAQSEINQRFGIGQSATAGGATFSTMQGQADRLERGRMASVLQEGMARGEANKRAAESEDKLAESIRRRIPTQASLNEEVAQYQSLLARGKISQEEAAGAIDVATKRFRDYRHAMEGVEGAGRRVSNEMTNMSFQLNDVVTGLMLGQSPFMIMAQQGGQVLQILQTGQGGVTGTLKNMGSAIVSAITPARVAMGGLAVAAAAIVLANSRWGDSQRELTRALYGTGLSAGVTTQQLTALAEAAGRASNVSAAAARETIAAIAGRGNIDPSILGRATGLSRGLQATLSIEAAEANTLLADSLSRPAEGYRRITTALGGYSVMVEDHIRRLERQGRLYEAQQVLLSQIPARLAPVEAVTSGWARAWEAVTRGISNTLDRIAQLTGGPLGRFMDRWEQFSTRVDRAGGGDIGARRVVAQDNVNAEVETIRNQIAELKKASDDIRSGASGIVGSGVRGLLAANEAQIRTLEARLPQVERRAELINQRMAQPNAGAATLAARGGARVSEAFGDVLTANTENMTEGAARAQARLREELERRTRATNLAIESGRQLGEQDTTRLSETGRLIDSYHAITSGLEAMRKASAAEQAQPGFGNRLRDLEKQREAAQAALRGQFTDNGRGMFNTDQEFIATQDEIARRLRRTIDLTRERADADVQSATAITQSQRIAAQQRQVELDQREQGIRAGNDAERQAERERQQRILVANDNRQITEAMNERQRSVMLAIESERAQMAVQNGSIRQQESVRISTQLINDARREYIRLTGNVNAQVPEAEAAAYRRLADEMARVKQQAAELRIQQDTTFNRQTMFLSDGDRGIANQLRGVYGDQWQSQMDSAIAQQMRFNDTLKMSSDLANDFGRTFVSDILSGKNATEALGNALKNLGARLIQMAMDQAIRSLFSGIMGAFGGGLGGFGGSTATAILAKGGAFEGGSLQPFARGGAFTNSIVSRPTVFPFANGVGLMGEAGPEAIMPLRRTTDGRLGVSGMGGGAAVTSVRTGDTYITIQGNADKNTLDAIKAELDRRDRAMELKIPGLVTQGRRDRTIPRAA